ncbi:MAG: hypothetical protein HZA52_12970 [Planctomycetes bacterium]|nr:hypothetical protein [Planctomycetota bacterium]
MSRPFQFVFATLCALATLSLPSRLCAQGAGTAISAVSSPSTEPAPSAEPPRSTEPSRSTDPAPSTDPSRSTAPSQSTDVEVGARALVGDNDPHATQRANAERWLARVRAEPAHPLVEATLRLVSADQELFASTPELRDAVLALSGDAMSFRARGELARLQARVRAGSASLEGEPVDAFPGWLSRFSVLGPLGPIDDVDAARNESARLADPGFDREHDGLLGARLRWQQRVRSPLEATTPRLDLVLGSREGHALLAFEFEAERATAAWLEIDARDGRGSFVFDVASTQNAPWTFSAADPSFDWTFNAESSGRVDYRAGPRSGLELVPVRVARGANVLVLSVATDADATFAVRVLDERGEPLAGLRPGRSSKPREYDGVGPPSDTQVRSTDSISVLSKLERRGPCTEAVLGVLTVLDGSAADGLAHVEAAVAAAPNDAALASLCGTVVRDAPHLPDAWRRNRARELYAKAFELEPRSYRAALELARRLASEEKKEEALTSLIALTELAPEREEAWLELERVYDDLGLTVQAERSLEHVFAAPAPSWTAFERAIARLDAAGRSTSAYLALVRAVAAVGATQSRLVALAYRAHSLGLIDEAERWHRARIARAAIADPVLSYASFLLEVGRLNEADAAFARAAELAPSDSEPWRRRAELAHRLGRHEDEREALVRVLALEPSDRASHVKLQALDAEGPLAPIDARRRALDERSKAAYASYAPVRSDESVVRVLDWSDSIVFADGGYEALTHTILHLRDLKACEAHGTQRLPGEVLKVVTRKADGREIEPIESEGEYVMPALEPGDFIETVTVDWSPPPGDGVVRFPRWHFASVDEPFHLSHYSMTAPPSLGLVVARRHFGELVGVVAREGANGDGTYTWTFESHDAPRIVPEPGAPPPERFLPNVEFGMRPNVDRLAAALASFAAVSARVTPPIEQACREALAGLAGSNGAANPASEDARARALYAWVARNLDRRNAGTFASAACALATRDGNPVWLFSALLDAAGIEHEIVFSRDQDPAADLEKQDEFFDVSRWLGRMLVHVRPKDGPEAWCDPSSKTLPYGKTIGQAPRAECFGTRTRRFLSMPDLPLIDRVGQRIELDVQVAADRSAEVAISFLLTGNVAFAQKESFRDMPTAQRKRTATQVAASLVPNFDLASFEFANVDGDDLPLIFTMKGRVKRFLDDANGELSASFPLPPLDLASQLTGGEGARRLPYYLGGAFVTSAEVRLELPEGVTLDGDGPQGALAFGDGTYTLTTRPADGERKWVLRRALAVPPFLIPKERYETFVQFASAVDELERARIRFRR